jgi:hypothetical protein
MAVRKQRCFGLIIILMSTYFLSYYFMTGPKELLHYSHSYKPSLLAESSENMCGGLYDIARHMLSGSQIPLPFTTNDTRWKFYKGKNPNLLDEALLIWNSEGEMSKEVRAFINLYNKTKAKDIKVRKHFITFANECCHMSKLKAVMSALYPGGFDKTKIHDLSSLSAGFKRTHSKILTHIRGSGYWLWKPYIILKTLVQNMAAGEILMYQDSGAYLIQDTGPLLKLCEHTKYGILLFYITFLEQHYSKRDAFVLMHMDNQHVYQTFQSSASFMLFQKNCMSLQFVMEWLAYASDPRLITDMDNTLGKQNLPGFREHRHDQSILSLLSKKWQIMAYRTPSQYGNMLGYKAGPYSQIIMHNRNRN